MISIQSPLRPSGFAIACALAAAVLSMACSRDTGAERAAVTGTLRVRVMDTTTGEPTTAMLCIRNLDDGTLRLPPDGRIASVSRIEDFERGYERSEPAQATPFFGPVRKTTGLGDNRDRSGVYGPVPSLVHWSEPVLYQVPGTFETKLPAGRYRISVERGMETIPVSRDVVVDGSDLDIRLDLERWITMADTGWYSGDLHVHHPVSTQGHREFLLGYAEAEDLHVVNVLEMDDHGGSQFVQPGFGSGFRTLRGSRALVPGREAPRGRFGHLIGLNLARRVPFDTTMRYDDILRSIQRQPAAITGFAHAAWRQGGYRRGWPWLLSTGAIDFVELMQFRHFNTKDYYNALNLGFRLTAGAGSDLPWGSTLGEVRTYVYTGGDSLDVDAWFAGLDAGHSFVTNGPMLEFSVDGAIPGTTLDRQVGDVVVIRARARGHPGVVGVGELVVVGNDGVLDSSKERSVDRSLSIEHRLVVVESRWFAAVVTGPGGAQAHSTPVYVHVGGRPHWSVEQAPALIAGQLRALTDSEAGLSGPAGERLRARIQKARRSYEALLQRILGEGPAASP